MPGCLFARFAYYGGEQGFPVFEVSGGLIEDQPAGDAFFDQQVARVAFHDRRHGDLGIERHD